MPKTFAAFSVSRSPGGPITLVGLTRTATRAMRRLLEQLQPFRVQLGREKKQARHVAARMGHVLHESERNRIATRCSHHDRDSARGVESGLGGAGGIGNDYIDGNANQFRSESGKSTEVSISHAQIDLHRLPLNIAETAHSLAERFDRRAYLARGGCKDAYSRHLRGLLCSNSRG